MRDREDLHCRASSAMDSPTNKNKKSMNEFKLKEAFSNTMSSRGGPSTCSSKPKSEAGGNMGNKTPGMSSRHARTSSRSSLSSDLSSSHASPTTPGPSDETKFISQAVSHLTRATKSSDIPDMYNVQFDIDIKPLPIDNVKHGYNLRRQNSPTNKNKKSMKHYDTMHEFKLKEACSNKMSSRGGPSTCSPKPKSEAGGNMGNKTPGMSSRHARTSSRSSLSSDLSSSHASPTTPGPSDETKFISQAVSHQTRATKSLDIPDMYNVQFDIDIKPLPIDNVKHGYNLRSRAIKKRKSKQGSSKDAEKKHNLSVLSTFKSSTEVDAGNTTQRNIRKCGNTSSSDSDSNTTAHYKKEKPLKHLGKGRGRSGKDYDLDNARRIVSNNNHEKSVRSTPNQKSKGISEEAVVSTKTVKSRRHSTLKTITGNIRETFTNMFRWRRRHRNAEPPEMTPPYLRHELPFIPAGEKEFALSMNKVKDYGWYWGPIAVEAAEKILENEPDGSFLVRDGADGNYIFTLTFKLDGIRNVRIEHARGCFCFVGCTLFKAHTIVEFVETAVEISLSGRYLFFLNLCPEVGPVRVQLLYPVSRFKRVQALQHLCRLIILKHVRRDLISSLPLPRMILDYLRSPHYYSEMLADV